MRVLQVADLGFDVAAAPCHPPNRADDRQRQTARSPQQGANLRVAQRQSMGFTFHLCQFNCGCFVQRIQVNRNRHVNPLPCRHDRLAWCRQVAQKHHQFLIVHVFQIVEHQQHPLFRQQMRHHQIFLSLRRAAEDYRQIERIGDGAVNPVEIAEGWLPCHLTCGQQLDISLSPR